MLAQMVSLHCRTEGRASAACQRGSQRTGASRQASTHLGQGRGDGVEVGAGKHGEALVLAPGPVVDLQAGVCEDDRMP